MSRSAPSTPQKPKNIPKDVLFSPGKRSSKKDMTPIDKSVAVNLFETTVPACFVSKVPLTDEEKLIYKIINKANSSLGGNGSTGAIYGEITQGSMRRVYDLMINKCEFSNQSVMIDVGAGLGKPNVHASIYPGVRLSIGIELEELRWQMSMPCLKAVMEHRDSKTKAPLNGHTHFMVGDIDIATTLDPFSHVYMYDLGFPPPLQQSIAVKFNTSQECRYLISYRPPHRVINEYLYDVTFVDSVNTSMIGSGENHTCYFYKRNNKPPTLSASAKKAAKLLTLEPREGHPDDPVSPRVVHCDPAFYETCRLAAALDPSELKTFVDKQVYDFNNSGRPVRDRKPRVMHDAV